jgi:hypothetical protein
LVPDKPLHAKCKHVPDAVLVGSGPYMHPLLLGVTLTLHLKVCSAAR